MTTEPSPPSRSRSWQASGARASASQQAAAGRRVKIGLVIFAMLLLIGALAAWVLWPARAPQPYALPIWMSAYSDLGIPVNPWAEEDRKAWLELPLRHNNAFTSQQRNLLVTELGRLEKVENPDEPVVVFLSGYAVTDPDGPGADGKVKVFLLSGDARLEDRSTWLPLEAVLRPLGQPCPARHKLLILDVYAPFTDPTLGVLAADVAAHLEPALKAAAESDGRLQIFAACAPGQVSHAAEDLGHSVFSYYLLQGLRGQADGHNPEGRRDARVSLPELVDYVSAEVDRWAWTNRRERQTPVLYGSRTDFGLAGVDPEKSSLAPAPLETKYPDWLRNQWALRDQWWADETFRAAPGTFRRLEAALHRAEQQWRGGVRPDDSLKRIKDLQTERQLLLEQRDRQRAEVLERLAGSASHVSLAQAAGTQPQPPPDRPPPAVLRDIRGLKALYVKVHQAKPDEKDKEQLKTDTAAFLKKYEGKPFDLAWTLFTALLTEDRPEAEQVALTLDLLRDLPDLPTYSEVRFLEQLHDRVRPADPKDWPAEAVAAALQVRAEEEKVLLTAVQVVAEDEARSADVEPKPLAWVRDQFTAVRKQREAADKLLWAKDEPAARKKLAEVRTILHDYRERLRTVAAAQRSRDEAVVLLPGYLAYLEAEPDAHQRGDLEKHWQEAAATAVGLQEVLAAPGDAAPLPERLRKMKELSAAWERGRAELAQPFQPAALEERKKERSEPAPADWKRMSALLELPWLSARDRADLAVAWRSLGSRLQKKSPEAPASSFDTREAQKRERDRALLRARCSVELLKLVRACPAEFGVTGPAGELEKKERDERMQQLDDLARASRAQPDTVDLVALARQLRTAWAPYRPARAPGK